MVLDASALLCLLYGEVGGDRVESVVIGAVMSTVNYAEVVSKLVERGRYDSETRADLAHLNLDVVPLDVETGELADSCERIRVKQDCRWAIAAVWLSPREWEPRSSRRIGPGHLSMSACQSSSSDEHFED